MITSQTTPIQDFEYLNNLDLDGKIDLLNSESQKLIEKYGSGDAFKQALLNAKKESKTYNGNLPTTETLEEAQTGDANLAESIARSTSDSRLPVEFKSGPNINQPVVPSTMYTEEKPYDPDIGETGFGIPGAAEGLNIMGGYVSDKASDYIKKNKPHLLDSEVSERLSETGDAKIGEIDDFDAYKLGRIKDKKDLYGYDKGLYNIDDTKSDKDKFSRNIEGIVEGAKNFGGDKLRAFNYDLGLKNKYKDRTKAMGMKSPGDWDYVYYDDERYNPDKGLEIKGSNHNELLKREEIVKKAEMTNPGDPNAGEKALNEYLMTQKTKLDNLDKGTEIRVPVGDKLYKEGSGRATDTGGILEVQRRKSDQFKEDVKKQILEEAENNPNVDKGGLKDLKKITKGKGWELLMHMGLGIATERDVASGIKAGLQSAMEFEKAFGADASDFQIVELGDGRLVRVNKRTGEVMDTGEKGKGSEDTAAIKTLKFKAEQLNIDVPQLLRFQLMSGDKTYTEQITEMAKSIKSNYFVQPTNEQLLKDAKEIVDGINEMSSSSIDNLLQ
jgi:hypothetical protein